MPCRTVTFWMPLTTEVTGLDHVTRSVGGPSAAVSVCGRWICLLPSASARARSVPRTPAPPCSAFLTAVGARKALEERSRHGLHPHWQTSATALFREDMKNLTSAVLGLRAAWMRICSPPMRRLRPCTSGTARPWSATMPSSTKLRCRLRRQWTARFSTHDLYRRMPLRRRRRLTG